MFVLKWFCYSVMASYFYCETEGYCLKRDLVIARDVESIVAASDLCTLENYCEIHCSPDGYPHTMYHESIQSVYDDHPECHLNGTKLILPRHATPSNMKLNWLDVDMNITELEVDFFNVYQFFEGVFQSNMFANMKTLKIDNLQPCELRKWIFVGLESLENLIITNVNFDIIFYSHESDILESLSGSLKTFHLTELQPRKTISIQNFVGGNTILPHLEYIRIQSNLSSIDALKSNLQILNLERNRLMALPSGIFTNILVAAANGLSIKLNDNPWHCDCLLEHLKELLSSYSVFDGEALCYTPKIIENYPIKDTEFCPIPIPTDDTTILSTESTSTSEITTPECIIDCGDFFEKECSSYQNFGLKNKIQIQQRIQSIQLSVKLGDVAIELQNNSPNMVLIWFASGKSENDLSEYYQSDDLDCVTDLSKEIIIKNLDEETTYTFCLMNRGATTVSPFDCISYYHQVDSEHNKMWLFEGSKFLIISVVVIGVIRFQFIDML